MKGVTLVLVLTAELVLCNEHGLPEPQSVDQQALNVGDAYLLGQKYEVLNSMVVVGDLAGQKPNTPEDYWKYSQSKSLNKMRISAFEQIRYRFPTPGTQALNFGTEPRVGRRGETNKVVAFWDGVCHETQFTIDTLKQFKSPDTKLAESITLAKQRRVEASKQFVVALLFGNYDEQPRIWNYTDKACSKVIKYKYAKDAEYTKSIKLGFIALIKEHRYAKELVSKMSFEELPVIQLLFVYGMLCKVEQESRDSALTIGLAEAPSISSSGWADTLKLLESHAPRIDPQCHVWTMIRALLDGSFSHLLCKIPGVIKEYVEETAGMSVNSHGSAEAPPSSSSGAPTTSRRSNPSATSEYVEETAGMSVNSHGSAEAPPSSSSGAPTTSRRSNPSATSVEASKQFVVALLFGNSDERPRIWKYTDEACSKVIKYAKDAEYTKSIKLGFIALIKEHRYAKELVSKMSFEELPPLQLVYVYGMLCKVEQESRDSASTTGLAEAPSISSSGWADTLKLLESHAPRIDPQCHVWTMIRAFLDGSFSHLLCEMPGVIKEYVEETAGMSVNSHGSAEAPPSSSSGSPATSRRSNPSATSGSLQRYPTLNGRRHSSKSNGSP